MKNKSIDYKIKNSLISVKPYIYTEPSISVISLRMLILLFVQILVLIFTKSFDAIKVIGFSTAGTLLASVFCQLITKRQPYHFLTVVLQGVLFGMLLPETFPIVSVLSISFFIYFALILFVAKNVNTWGNVVSICVILAWIIGRDFFPEFILTKDLLQLKNPSALLIKEGAFPIYNFDVIITEALNNSLFNNFKVTLPTGYLSLLWDSHSIIPAFRFNFLTIVSSIILYSDDSYSGIIPSTFLIVYSLLVRCFVPFMAGGMFNQGDVILALLTSGTLFCAVFLIQWFGTTPFSLIGKIVYGILCGIVAFLIVGCGNSPIGMVYTILICNVLNMMIRIIEEKIKLKSMKKNLAKIQEENKLDEDK